MCKVTLAFLVVFIVGQVQCQSILDNLSSGIRCATELPAALSDCQSKLRDRLDLVDKAEEKIGKKYDRTMFNCCYYAEFAHCLDEKTGQKCSKEVASFIGTFAADFAKTLNKNCEDYNYTVCDQIHISPNP